MIGLIAFDFDGVLFSSDPMIDLAYAQAIEKLFGPSSIPIPTKEQILHKVGMQSHAIIEQLFPTLDPDKREELKDEVLHSLIELIKMGKGELYEGVPLMLKQLKKKYLLVLASNGRKEYIEAVIEHYHLSHFFSPSLFVSPEMPDKKAILMAYACIYGLSFSEMVFVGDRIFDWEVAQSFGQDGDAMPFVAALYGHHTQSERVLWTHRYQAKRPVDIVACVESIAQRMA